MVKLRYDLLNSMASSADPELRKFAEILSAKLDLYLQDKSWLRTKPAERFAGVIKGLIESQAQGKGPVMATILEKFTDLLDFGGVNFFHDDKSAAMIADEWLKQFLAEADEHLRAAETPDEIELERARFRTELEVRQEIVKTVRQSAGDAQTEKQDAKPGSRGSSMRRLARSMRTQTERMKAKRKENV